MKISFYFYIQNFKSLASKPLGVSAVRKPKPQVFPTTRLLGQITSQAPGCTIFLSHVSDR